MRSLTKSERSVLKRIKIWMVRLVTAKSYDFWFTYNKDERAIGWEGGFDMPLDNKFRNQYSILSDNTLRVNWES